MPVGQGLRASSDISLFRWSLCAAVPEAALTFTDSDFDIFKPPYQHRHCLQGPLLPSEVCLKVSWQGCTHPGPFPLLCQAGRSANNF